MREEEIVVVVVNEAGELLGLFNDMNNAIISIKITVFTVFGLEVTRETNDGSNFEIQYKLPYDGKKKGHVRKLLAHKRRVEHNPHHL